MQTIARRPRGRPKAELVVSADQRAALERWARRPKTAGTLKGHGARVVPVHTEDDMQPVVRGTHKGQENFIVDVIGYGDLSGTVNLFNEIGRFSGEVLADEELPAGDYLVYVQADGAWTLKFTP